MYNDTKKWLVYSLLPILLLLSLLAHATNAQDQQLLVLADIHFNPMSACAAETTCLPATTALNSSEKTWQKTLLDTSIKHFPVFKEETNVYLWQSTLNELESLNQAGKLSPSYIVLLGDYFAHHFIKKIKAVYPNATQKDIEAVYKQTMSYLLRSLHHVFPTTPIFIIIGNNDSFYGDYYSIPSGDFFHFLEAEQEKYSNHLLEANQKELITLGGFYSVRLPNTDIHFVMLNSNFFSAKAEGPNKNALNNVAKKQLAWLEKTLENIHHDNEKAWIFAHIPPKVNVFSTIEEKKIISFWQKSYETDFDRILERYQDSIEGVYSGHIHTDSFSFYEKNGKPLFVIMTFPSISPVYGNNTGFKVVNYSPMNGKLKTYHVYNLAVQTLKAPTWQLEYNYSTLYHGDFDKNELYKRIINPGFSHSHLSNMFRRYYPLQSDVNQAIETKDWLYYYCGMMSTSQDFYKTCIAHEK